MNKYPCPSVRPHQRASVSIRVAPRRFSQLFAARAKNEKAGALFAALAKNEKAGSLFAALTKNEKAGALFAARRHLGYVRLK